MVLLPFEKNVNGMLHLVYGCLFILIGWIFHFKSIEEKH